MAFDTISLSALSNPLNIVLFLVLLLLVREFQASETNLQLPAHPPEPIVLKRYTPQTLLPYTGEKSNPILVSILNRVYDVSRGAQFYGPGGPYSSFAGRDASRCLAKVSFADDLLADPSGPIDKLEDLDGDEWQTLRDWATQFEFKYDHVGFLVENGEDLDA
ncbi:hypothetical protein SpCBS45565_g04049 [Spizellomyces sp. 'palustris']|nr:hypothetical protein SpCBS45565_g04049 [Spizellomyces sp. 'palustris']